MASNTKSLNIYLSSRFRFLTLKQRADPQVGILEVKFEPCFFFDFNNAQTLDIFSFHTRYHLKNVSKLFRAVYFLIFWKENMPCGVPRVSDSCEIKNKMEAIRGTSWTPEAPPHLFVQIFFRTSYDYFAVICLCREKFLF
jgi:hypothetical protein